MKSQSHTLPWAKIDSFIGNHTSPTLLRHRPCPICGSLHCRTLLVLDDFQFFSDSVETPKRVEIREVVCQSCHSVYLNPCYTPTGFYYLFMEAGKSYGSTKGRQEEQIDWMISRGILDNCKVFLDVGCYDGCFLSFLPKNIRRIGVDIDAPGIARGQEKYGADGVELIHGALETFQCSIKPDVISMYHVLEHLANPVEVLSHLRSISDDKTRLVIEVPILEYGKTNDINGFLSVQHMTHFSEHSLVKLMTRAGWKILERQQMPGYNGHRILAKPEELSIEVMGKASDLVQILQYLEHWYRNLSEVARKIESWSKTSRMVIWGGGMHSEFLYQVTPFFQLDREREYLIVDSDPLKQGKSWRGLPIISPEELKKVVWNDCLLVISSYGGQEGITEAAINMDVPDLLIKRLYDRVNVY